MEENTIVAIINSAVALNKFVETEEASVRIKQMLFEHKFVEQCHIELLETKKVRPALDVTSFIMGFTAGAKVAVILQQKLLFDKLDPD